MLRFVKQHLATEDNAAMYGMISLLIFSIFFLIVLIRIYRMKKETIDELSNIPLGFDDDSQLQNEKQ